MKMFKDGIVFRIELNSYSSKLFLRPWSLVLTAALVSVGWFIPKYLVVLAYEAIRNF